MASFTPRQRASYGNLAAATATTTPSVARRFAGSDDIELGDTVDVPGGMYGIVKFVGEVRNKPGHFVGVELDRIWAGKGKNDGDADGIRYFTTSISGAGIFLPVGRAIKRSSPSTSTISPTTPSFADFSISEQDEQGSPTPSAGPKFSQTINGRASPAFKPRSRPSLPRPESPLRRAQAAVPSSAISGRPSLNTLAQNKLPGPRYAPSPTPAKMTGKIASKSSGYAAATVRPSTRSTTRDEDDELSQLRFEAKERNEKIASLTAEFDSHRADFRKTLDTLEMASTETERIYEKKVEDLLEERSVLIAQADDVESVAAQLRQLEEVVQELEEGLEDARRGEAEARGEVEFLRGEVERVRAELRREREKNHAAMVAEPSRANSSPTPYHTSQRVVQGTPVRQPQGSPEQAKPDGLALQKQKSPKSVGFNGQARLAPESLPGPAEDKPLPNPPIPSSPLPDTVKVSDNLKDPDAFKVAAVADVFIASRPDEIPFAQPNPNAEHLETDQDGEKWCAMCEQDGHDILTCPSNKF